MDRQPTIGNVSVKFRRNPFIGSEVMAFTIFLGHHWLTLTFDPMTFTRQSNRGPIISNIPVMFGGNSFTGSGVTAFTRFSGSSVADLDL